MRLINLLKKELVQEARDWVKEDIISREQANVILARYGQSLEQGQGKGAFGYYVLMSLAVFFAGLSLLLLVSENWNQIPRMLRMVGLLVLTLSSNGMGLFYFRRQNYRASVLWLLFGSISYGVSIMLIAQIYHLGEHFPDGIYWWALGVLPLVVATQSRLIAFLVAALAFIWMFVEAGLEFFPLSFPIFILVVGWLIFWHKTSNLLYLMVITGALIWLNLSVSWLVGGRIEYEVSTDMVLFNIGLGLIFNGFSWRLMSSHNSHWKSYGLVSHLWLLRASLITLFIFSFDDVWHEFQFVDYQAFWWSVTYLFVAGVAGLSLARRSGKHAYLPMTMIWLYFLISFSLLSLNQNLSFYLTLLTNIVLVVMGILLIRRGIHQVESHYFYTGVVTLLILAFIRYFDLIGGYLGGAALFLVAASILLGAARYWKKVQGDEQPDDINSVVESTQGGRDHDSI